MERARKMVLIPQESLHKMQAGVKTTSINTTPTAVAAEEKKTVQTPGDKFSRLDGEMRDILDSEKYTTDSDKYRHLLQVLHRYLFLVDEKRKIDDKKKLSENKSVEKDQMNDEYILESVPKLYKNKTKLLLNHLKNNNNRISWSASGIVTIDGEKIKNSNIIDLVNDAARVRKNIKAVGRHQFAELLSTTQTPREFVGNSEFLNLNASLSKSRFENSLEKSWKKKSRGRAEEEEDSDEDIVGFFKNKSDSSLMSETVVAKKSKTDLIKNSGARKSTRTSTPIVKRWNELNFAK